MKKRFMIMAATAIAALSVQAQGSDELAVLQKQLNELSAKIAQMEQSNTDKIAKLEESAAKNKIPDWVNDTKFKGDFRYRYENISTDGTNSKDRQRVRLRVGAYGSVNDYVDYGVRLATGGSSATSANQDIDGGTKKEIMLDQYYVDLHPDLLMGSHLIMGKMPQPWIDRTGLIWDGDLNPEGLALTYKNTYSNGVTLMANAGSFVIKEDKGDDLQLWAAQLAGEAKVGDAKVTLGVSDFYYQNAGSKGAALTTSGANTPGTGFNLVEGFGKVSTKIGDLPFAVNGQYVMNVDAASSDDTAYLFGFALGKAKNKGDWEAGYNYRDTGADAVPDGFNDSDFANGLAGSHGHSFWAKYQIAKNLQGGLTYMMAVDNADRDVNLFQADLNFKF
ncbi:MAG: putative porin [Kiritimatiellales bacterium]|nr:putative porin [Kiritimatiellales bacterium]